MLTGILVYLAIGFVLILQALLREAIKYGGISLIGFPKAGDSEGYYLLAGCMVLWPFAVAEELYIWVQAKRAGNHSR